MKLSYSRSERRSLCIHYKLSHHRPLPNAVMLSEVKFHLSHDLSFLTERGVATFVTVPWSPTLNKAMIYSKRVGSYMVGVVLVAFSGCNGDSEPEVSGSADTTSAPTTDSIVQAPDSFRLTTVTESGDTVTLAFERLLDPPGVGPGGLTGCAVGILGPADARPVGPGEETLTRGPGTGQIRNSRLRVRPGQPGNYSLREMPDPYPSVHATGNSNRQVELTLETDAACQWPNNVKLTLYRHRPGPGGGTWDVITQAPNSTDRSITAELPGLSRFAVGTSF